MNIQDIMQLSLDANESRELDCNVSLTFNDVTYQAYTVSIAYRDLLFFTDKGALSCMVDSFGDRQYLSLFNIEE